MGLIAIIMVICFFSFFMMLSDLVREVHGVNSECHNKIVRNRVPKFSSVFSDIFSTNFSDIVHNIVSQEDYSLLIFVKIL